jgi:colanic acid/amylovoran biosynthesis glycosyltransferase
VNLETIPIIHSCPEWLPQTQTWMYTQVMCLPEYFETHIVCDRTMHLEQFFAPNIHCLHETTPLRYYWEKGIRKLLVPHYRGFLSSIAKNVKARMLHSHFGPNGWVDKNVVKQFGMKHLVTYYGYDVGLPGQDKRWISRYRELFDEADAFLFEGPYMAKQLIIQGCPKEKIHVHHLGISIDTIPYKPRQLRAGEPLRILLAASFTEKKGIPYALEALAQLQQDTSLEITIIGDAGPQQQSKNEKKRILDIINHSGLKDKTRLLGYQPYSVLFDEAYNHHIFISPSVTASTGDTEGGAPVTLIEMMATGMPVVSTNHCDIPEVVQYGIENWLVDERDVSGLVKRLRWLLENPNELEFDAAQQGGRLAKIYQDVLNH